MNFEYKEGDRRRVTSNSFYRGQGASYYPSDDALEAPGFLTEYVIKGTAPKTPIVSKETGIVAFGSCFAAHISRYLDARGYNILTKKDDVAYISRMGDGIVNTFSIRQQFEWAWLDKVPQGEYWHGYDAKAFGYDDSVRLATKELFDQASMFIITLGLSEIWYDEPTGQVFWRAVPAKKFDPARHKFRNATQAENLDNLREILRLIRQYNPSATVLFTLSPIPLTATFRPVSCMVANAVSKASLRSALDELMQENGADERLFYFPSYDIVRECFENRFLEDRKHVHEHILAFVMQVFECYYCGTVSEEALDEAFAKARELDRRVGLYGHWSVGRITTEIAGISVRERKPPLCIRMSQALRRLISGSADNAEPLKQNKPTT